MARLRQYHGNFLWLSEALGVPLMAAHLTDTSMALPDASQVGGGVESAPERQQHDTARWVGGLDVTDGRHPSGTTILRHGNPKSMCCISQKG